MAWIGMKVLGPQHPSNIVRLIGDFLCFISWHCGLNMVEAAPLVDFSKNGTQYQPTALTKTQHGIIYICLSVCRQIGRQVGRQIDNLGIFTNTFIYIHVFFYVSMCYIGIYIYIHTHTHTYIYIYTTYFAHAYTNTHIYIMYVYYII